MIQLLLLHGSLKDYLMKPPSISKYLSPKLNVNSKIKVEFTGSCLTRDKIAYTHGTIVNIYIVYEMIKNNPINSYPTLENCLFGAAKVTKNPNIDNCKYSGYGMGFDRKGKFSFGGGFGQNVMIFGAEMSSSVHANNKTKNILVLGEDITQGSDDTTLTAEKMYLISFTENNKKFCLSPHYNR